MKTPKIRQLKLSKNLKNVRERLEQKKYTLEEGIKVLRSVKYAKFDETLEIAMRLGVDPKHSDQMVRGMVSLPAGTGRNVRVAAICKDTNFEIAKSSGADIVGSGDVIEDIKAGKINFDILIVTPDMMASLAQVARILGPKGLMPNPKLGTVATDIATAIKNAKAGQVEFRVEKQGIIHAGVGKMSFTDADLLSNTKALIGAVQKAKPAGAKGVYIKAIYLSSTMGPSVKVDLAELSAA
jgi:large subunit ribosomal protein L1